MGDLVLEKQVDTIRQTFGYVQRYKDATFVIKIDSRLITHPLFPILIRDVVLLHNAGIRIVLIPGTRVRIDEVLQSFSIQTEQVNDIRISSEEAIPFVKMAAFDVSNKIMTMLAENNANAVIGNWVRARGIGVRDGIDYQSTGMIDKVNSDLIRRVLDESMIPIFPNIGWSFTGKPYNISSNELALQISIALKAEKLFFITDFGGISAKNCLIPSDIAVSKSKEYISQLTAEQAKHLLDHNPELRHSEEFQLLHLGHKAASAGVERVHIVGGRTDGMLLKEIFSNRGLGTMIYTNQHDKLRSLAHKDIPEVLRITQPLIKEGILIERSNEDLESTIEEYIGYEVDNTFHGCGALHRHEDGSAEIYSIAIDASYKGLGIGKKIISYLIEQAVSQKLETLFLLTTQTSDWFADRGFVEGKVEDLPIKRQEAYNWQRRSRILTLNLKDEQVLRSK